MHRYERLTKINNQLMIAMWLKTNSAMWPPIPS